MSRPEIYSRADAIHVEKDNGTSVDYFLFDEYEVHLNAIRPHTVQEWHYHREIEETIMVTEGTLTLSWMEGVGIRHTSVPAGGLVRVLHSVHTFSNETDTICRFTVFRFVPSGKNQREKIKGDKTVVDPIHGK